VSQWSVFTRPHGHRSTEITNDIAQSLLNQNTSFPGCICDHCRSAYSCKWGRPGLSLLILTLTVPRLNTDRRFLLWLRARPQRFTHLKSSRERFQMNQQISEKSGYRSGWQSRGSLAIFGILGLIISSLKANRFVKFHGIQSVLYSVGLGLPFHVLWVICHIGFICRILLHFGLLSDGCSAGWTGGLCAWLRLLFSPTKPTRTHVQAANCRNLAEKWPISKEFGVWSRESRVGFSELYLHSDRTLRLQDSAPRLAGPRLATPDLDSDSRLQTLDSDSRLLKTRFKIASTSVSRCQRKILVDLFLESCAKSRCRP